jgi:hypothetical protein
MQRFLVMLVISAALMCNRTALAEQGPQSHQSSPQKGSTVKGQDSADLFLQQERLELEKQKYLLDVEMGNKKLEIERDKLRIEEASSKWLALSAAGPLTIALGTLAFSIWSFRKQGRQQADMQLEAAKLQFEIKAAEIAFSGRTPKAVANRAKVLKAFFPDRLPDDFTQRFSPDDFGSKEPPEEKKFFLELLLKHPGKEAEVFDLWTKLFPGDEEWLLRVKTLSEPQNAVKEAQASPVIKQPAPE